MNEYIHFSMHTMRQFKRIQQLLDQLDPAGTAQAFIVPASPLPRGGVIVFAGSFNPPTIAHLAMLKQAYHYAHERAPMHVYAAISKHTIDKEVVERPLLLDRIMLLKTLLHRRLHHAGIMLFNRGLYVEQAEAIHRSFPAVKHILFLMGFDKIVQVFDPRYYEDRDAALTELFRLAQLLVAPRGNAGKRELEELLQQPQNQPFARYVHALPFTNTYRTVSSTSVRQGMPVAMHEVPQEVRRFIYETRAYAAPLRRKDGHEVDYYAERVQQLNKLLCAMPPSIKGE
ncbi:MAG: hypothetical protein E6J34_13605 [Chloroflexi bacterium]|nr:MAG: hypothetical protein E6J34_13605 [Chloroflexota bacterium]